MIQFAYPLLLWLLLLVPLLLLVMIAGQRRRRKQQLRFATPQMLRQIMPDRSAKRDWWRASFKLIAIALLIVALARPQLYTHAPVSAQQTVGVDLAFCIDVSNSMAARDVKPDRIGFAKQIVTHTMQQLAGSRIAMVVFAGGAYIRLPLTPDLPTAQTFLADIQPGMVSNQGTNLGQALERSAQALSAPSRAGKAVILLTDGEDHEGGLEEGIERLKEQGIKAYVVTIGLPEGATIPIGETLLTDSLGVPVISKPNPEITADIADATGGQSFVGSSPRAISNQLVNQLRTLPQANLSGEGDQIEELYALPTLAALILLLLANGIMRRKSRLFSRIQIFGHHDA